MLSFMSLSGLSNLRNRTFIYLHLLLELLAYGEFSYEVFGFCREMDTTLASLSVPYILLIVKTYLFYLCITTDPGNGIVQLLGQCIAAIDCNDHCIK